MLHIGQAEGHPLCFRFAARYDELDGGGAAGALGFDDLRQELLGKV